MGAALVGGAGVAGLHAAEPTLVELDQKIRILERRLEVADEAAAAKGRDVGSVKAGRDGFSLGSADRAFQLKLRGIIQADGRFYLEDADKKATDSFLLRRVRPILEGRVHDDFGFRFTPDFADGRTVLYDAFGEYTPLPAFGIRAGKFKPPVGLERLQSAPNVSFIERGLPTQLVPNRDIGLQFAGDFASGTVQYAAGVFNGVVDGGLGDGDTNDAKDFAGRLFLHPFRATDAEALANFGIGISGSVGDQEGRPGAPGLPAFKSSGQQTFYSYRSSTNAPGTAYADGRRARLSPQAYFYLGPFGVLGEYVQSEQDVGNGRVTESVRNDAWQLLGSWVLTGEDASYRGVTPLFDFAPAAGHFGAFELVARYQQLHVDDEVFAANLADPKKAAGDAEGWGVGLNWYLNRNVKASLDYEQTAFEGGASTGDRPDEKIVFSRVQLAF